MTESIRKGDRNRAGQGRNFREGTSKWERWRSKYR